MTHKQHENVIEIFLNSKTGWLARFVGDRKVIELFGTDTLPTAFTAQAPVEMVEKAIQKLNPHHEVRRA